VRNLRVMPKKYDVNAVCSQQVLIKEKTPLPLLIIIIIIIIRIRIRIIIIIICNNCKQ